MKTLKTVLIVLSVLGNAALAALVALAFTGNSRSLSYHVMDADGPYTVGACIVSVGGPGENIVFSPVAVRLAAGDRAHLQYAAVRDGAQINVAPEALHDREIVSVSQTGYGVLITALAPGETVLQTVTAEGIRDLAAITVTEAEGEPY
jgi:hypothetical protein